MVTAEAIAAELGGKRSGSGWMARCPAHEDSTPSLSIRTTDDGRTLVHCFAGCDQGAVIGALKRQGLWPERFSATRSGPETESIAPKRKGLDSGRISAAARLWRAAGPATGTLVETYLKWRKIAIAPPATLRFHPRLRHRSGGCWPAMIALVTRGVDDVPLAVHRTFLQRHGAGKAPVSPAKMMLGSCRGAAVRLAHAEAELMVGEGIETCLAAMQVAGIPAWAALSTSGLRTLDLPEHIKSVIVLADGDEPGEAAAKACAGRWKREGRAVRIAWPPKGRDFNDLLMSHTAKFGAACR
ncbi:MAG: toprim domain-containing protein [Pseudomonadota bacterium]